MLSDIEQELIHIRNNYEDINRYITVADEWEGMYSKNMIKGSVLIAINYEYDIPDRTPVNPKYYARIYFRGDSYTEIGKVFYSNDFQEILDKRDEFIKYLMNLPENIELRTRLTNDGFTPYIVGLLGE